MTTFVDTNVLVYARDASHKGKQRRARAWMEHLWSTGTGRVSSQVLSEFYVTVTRKLAPGMPLDEARADVADLAVWRPEPVDAELIELAFEVEGDAGLSYWDALIVAAAQRTRSTQLLTEDLNDGQTIGTVTIVNPFNHPPPID